MNNVNPAFTRALNEITLTNLKLVYKTFTDARTYLECFRRKDSLYMSKHNNQRCHSIGICIAIDLGLNDYLSMKLLGKNNGRINYKKLIESTKESKEIAFRLLKNYCYKKVVYFGYWWDKHDNALRIRIVEEIMDCITNRIIILSKKTKIK